MNGKNRPCHCCRGTGKELDHQELGSRMRQLRLSKGMSLRRLGILLRLSAPYLSDLELGRRHWSEALVESYKIHLK